MQEVYQSDENLKQERIELLKSAKKHLPLEEQVIFDLLFNGYSNVSISKILGVPIGRMNRRVKKIILELKRIIAIIKINDN